MAVTLVIAAGVASKAAYADPAEFFASLTGDSAQSRAFSDHTVDTVTPHGTTINLFDYWTRDRDANDYPAASLTEEEKAQIANSDSGINSGHDFKFTSGTSGVNNWQPLPRTGIVEDELGSDGYPMLVAGNGINTPESLAYLFDTNIQSDGKLAFSNVGGLLQVDSEGYYYYDSTQNFASFDESTNNFTVYNTKAVHTEDPLLSANGQFFPFNTASDVFTEQGNQLVEKGISAKSNDVNHWFGASMTTRFVQPTDGLTAKNEQVTYHFSGDDDVWVYIDGVLVGDLGGIHSKADLDINFATGKVVVTGVQGNGTPHTVLDTDLRTLFEAAGMSTEGWEGNTFPQRIASHP